MHSVTQNSPIFQGEQESRQVELCALSLPLDDCPARRVAGCRSHFELLNYMFPPLRVLAHVRDAMGNDPDARQWIARLDSVLPGKGDRR